METACNLTLGASVIPNLATTRSMIRTHGNGNGASAHCAMPLHGPEQFGRPEWRMLRRVQPIIAQRHDLLPLMQF